MGAVVEEGVLVKAQDLLHLVEIPEDRVAVLENLLIDMVGEVFLGKETLEETAWE
jgi:hypothetical protein